VKFTISSMILVCDWLFSHSGSDNFTLRLIEEEQVLDYAKRKGLDENTMLKRLSMVMK
ncbi:homocysteine-N5-methyltetrahydrofolate transmethylase, B12-dependent, partial [Pasteurella multocida subsp. multocida str. P52VAC]